MMKKILVTGGSGFIGRHTLAPLIARGYEVHIASRHGCHSANKHVTTHRVDLLDCSTHQSLIEFISPTHLLHTAWYTENGKFWDAVDNVYWLKATISLADAFYNAGGQRLVGLGTCAEYDWTNGLCVENTTLEIPASLYGKVKKSAYECLTALAAKYKSEIAWARIFFPYGPGEPAKRLIPYVISTLLRDETASCTHGKQIRDFMHVSDMGDALANIVDTKVAGAINVGTGTSITIRDIVEQIAEIMGKKGMLKFGAVQEPAYSPAKILADTDRLKTEVNWSAKLSLKEGLSQTIDWWREHGAERLTRGELVNEDGN